MKKVYLSLVMVISALVGISQGRIVKTNDPLVAQMEASRKSAAPYSIMFRENANQKLSDAPAVLNKYLQLRSGIDELRLKSSDAGKYNIVVNRYQQYFRGIKVEHGAYIVTARNGIIIFINGDYFSLKTSTPITATLTEASALEKALQDVGASVYKWQLPGEEAFIKRESNNPSATYFPKAELVLVEDYNTGKELTGKVSLAYKFDIYAHEPMSRAYVYVDANTGKILLKDAIIKHAGDNNGITPQNNGIVPGLKNGMEPGIVNTVVSPDAVGTAATRYSGTVSIPTQLVSGNYRLQAALATENYPLHTMNMQKGTNYAAAVEFTDADNNWTTAEYDNPNRDNAALDAHWGAMQVVEYWRTRHARNSYDNANAIINSYVHYGNNFNNAFWNGTAMTYGDGSNTNGGFSPLTGLDVCGHEIGHAVCTYTANLVYQRESGALNEALSDIWGASIEHFADPHETDAVPKSYFLIGEEIGLPYPNSPLRSMSDPKSEGQPDTYGGTLWRDPSVAACPVPNANTNDNCWVHYNSGVLNHWFYILVNGKTGTNDVGYSYSITGIGWVDAEKIVYLGEQNMTSSADYKAARTAMYNAAVTLFGVCSVQASTVLQAFDAVNVKGAGAQPSFLLTQSVQQQSEGLNVTYTNKVTSLCPTQPFSNYLITDTLPTNVTFVSATNGGTYNAGNRVVSFVVNVAGGATQNYSFTVSINPGSYYPTTDHINETVAGPGLPATWTATTTVPASGSPAWVVSAAQSHSAPNSLFGVNAAVASDMRLSLNAPVAMGTVPPVLTFWHNYNTEAGWDGGVVEISTNGGTTWTDLGPNMVMNGYNNSMGTGSNNPIGGRAAFSGNSNGFIQTRVKLTPYAGQNALFRFRAASDDNTAVTGWYVDDILLRSQALVEIRSNLFDATGTRIGIQDTFTIILPPAAGCPTITTQPANTTVCVNSTATFNVVAAGVSMSYQWQQSTNGGGTWTDLTNAAPYSNVTTATLTINPTTLAMNGYQYRCRIITSACPAGVTSNAATLTVLAAAVGGTVTPATTNVCGTTNSGTLTLSGHTGNVVRWESATNPAGPWTPIANTSTTYTFNNITQTMYYRAVVQVTGCAEVNSSVATVTFTASNAITIVADPGTTLCQGDPTRLTVMEVLPAVPVTVNHSSSNAITAGNSVSCNTTGVGSQPNSFWRAYNLSAFPAVSAAFTINSVTFGIEAAQGSTQAIAVRLYNQTGAAFPGGTRTQIASQTYNIPVQSGTLYTATFTTPVTVPNTATIIVEVQKTTQVTGQYFFIGSNAAAQTGPSYLSAAACGFANPTDLATLGFPNMHIIEFLNGTVQPPGAMVSTGTFVWTPAAGLSSTTTNPVAASPATTTTYTVNHNNGAGCTRQASITINVNARPGVTVPPASTAVCAGAAATFTATTVGAGATYQWQESTDGGTTWNNVPAAAPYTGGTTTTLTISPATIAMNGNRYRISVSGTCPPTAFSSGAVLTVNSLPVVTINPAGPVCGGVAGINAVQLTASSATGGNFTWSPAAGLYTNATATIPYVAGTPAASVYAAPTTNTTYTASATNGTTGCIGSATVTVNYTPTVPVVTPASAAICLGGVQQLTITSSLSSVSTTYTSGAVNIPVPDNTANGVTSNITVSGIPAGSAISNVAVTLNMSHSYPGDMIFNLKAPNGNILNLYKYNGGLYTGPSSLTPASGWYNAVVTSNPAAPAFSVVPAPYSYGVTVPTGPFKPDVLNAAVPGQAIQNPAGYVSAATSFNDLTTGDPNGVWTLAMADGGPGDLGTLTNWGITITYGPPSLGTWSPTAGLYTDAAAMVPYTGTPLQTVYASPTTIGVNNYSVTVSNGSCVSGARIVPVTVNQPVAITTQPANATACADKVATFTVTATGTAPGYQWQVSTDNGVTWSNIANGGVYSGATSATLTITAPPVSMNNYLYRVIVRGTAPCGSVTSNAATLRVSPLPVVVIAAAPYTKLFPGLVTTLSSNVTPNPAATYTWRRNGIVVPGANSATLNVDVDGLGLYTLQVTDVNTCTGVSNSILISDSVTGKVFIYPNPNTGRFQVRYHSVNGNTLVRGLTVYDAKGTRVLVQNNTIAAPYARMDVDMSKFGKGIYWVELGDLNGNRLAVGRVIIQ